MSHRGVVMLAVVAAAWALTVLEGARSGLSIEQTRYGTTPVTIYSDGSGGPAVVVAHGFAGSRQIMQAYSLVLAQAGYTVHAFDFEGHGQHPEPMGGDVTALDGTTQRLVSQTEDVIDAVAGEAPVALLGHSMATDVLVRAAQDHPRIGPLVLVSAFSRAIDARHPTHLLLVTGAWEPGLTEFALDAVRMVDPTANAGETVLQAEVTRRAVLAPFVEHVSVLHSRLARAEALAWLNGYYERDRNAAIPSTGWALLVLLAAVTALSGSVARVFPARPVEPSHRPVTHLAALVVLPACIAPALAGLADMQLLPVLVADYLALHLAIYGVVQIFVLRWFGCRFSPPALPAVAVLLIWGLVVFGLALNRYGANFWPIWERVPILVALAVGAVPFMFADAHAAFGAPLLHRVVLRIGFLASLVAAVALDFDGLFFLIMIAPVIVLFFLTFGMMGRAFARRAGPATSGLALGLVLAWALGVSFPLFSA